MNTDEPRDTSERQGKGPLRADQPIVSADQDQLDRGRFALSIAEDIRRAPRAAGFVMALTGAWGEGKTSVINLVAAELEAADDAVVVRFNPWLFSGTEQLAQHFFDELGGQLQIPGGVVPAGVVASLRTYGRLVAPLRVVPVIGEVARSSGELAESVAGVLSPDRPSAHVQARELRERLEKLDRPIVVLVDDLDRLRPEEIVDVMRLVRLVGDFPNLVYLLAFDRARVESALGEGNLEAGGTYLEKIVQVMHRLPAVRAEELSEVALGEISELVGDTDDFFFSREHFTNLFWSGMRDLFTTVRDVRRYVNVLPATLSLLRDEVELGDVLALEAIRVLAPTSFDRLVDAREALTSTSDNALVSQERRERWREQVVAIPQPADERQSAVRELLERLFPAAQRYLGGPAYGLDWLGRWQRERRVAHPEVLGIYLRRRLAPGVLPARDVEEVFAAFEDEVRLRELLDGMTASQLDMMLSRLQHYEQDYPGDRPEITIGVLLGYGALLQAELGESKAFGADVELSGVVYRLVRDLSPQRVEAVADAIPYPDISGRWEVARMIGHRKGSGHRLVDEQVAERFEQATVDAVLAASAANLVDERDLAALMAIAYERAPDQLRERIVSWLLDDNFLVRLLSGHIIVSRSHTMGEAAVRRVVQLNWLRLVRLVDQETFAQRIREVDSQWVQVEFPEDSWTAWQQALHYAENPNAAEQDLRRFSAGDDEED